MEEIDICKNGHITSYNPQYPQILTPYHIPFDPMARYQEATKSGVGPDSLVQVAAQCNIIYIYILNPLHFLGESDSLYIRKRQPLAASNLPLLG